MTDTADYRIEHDTMGEVRVPKDALYAAQTQRAVENFPISGVTVNSVPELIRGMVLVKKAAALANWPRRARWVMSPDSTKASSRVRVVS